MKVRNVHALDQSMITTHAVDQIHDPAARPLVFQKTMTLLSEEHHNQHLTGLMQQIDEQGARLGKRVEISEFEKYRTLVRSFLEEIVSNSYSYSRENSLESRGRHRFFATVKTVNEKLDSMAKELLSGQSSNLTLLAQVDEIRGMLVDVMM